MFKHLRTMLLLAAFSMALPSWAEVADPEWWKNAAEPYAGVTIRGVSERTTASNAIAEIAAEEFEQLTGIKVEFEAAVLDEMYAKALNDIQTGRGSYDFIYLEQDIITTYLTQGWLINLSQMMDYNSELVSKDFEALDAKRFEDFTSFIDHFRDANGDVFGIPFEAFLKTYVYRKDLFEKPEIQHAFQEQYGWDLKPPATWEQYEDIAEFFTQWGRRQGLEFYGHVAQAKNHVSLAYELEESIWPTWGVWNWGIDTDNWRATSANGGALDGEQAKDALKWYVEMLRYASPEVRSYTWDEVAQHIAAGHVAQGLSYAENTIWIATDENRSRVAGKIGVALPPVSDEKVLADIQAGEGYIGYYDGAAFGIPVSAENKEAALLFLQFVTRKAWAGEFAAMTGSIIRNSTLEMPLVQELDRKMDGYFTLLKESGSLFAGAPAFPMHLVLNEVQLKWIARAVAGEITAEEACDMMAAEIDNTLEELGY